jgi:hypothetical protein
MSVILESNQYITWSRFFFMTPLFPLPILFPSTSLYKLIISQSTLYIPDIYSVVKQPT